jgi:mediator of RNA polymerase II transcription subunit 12
MRETRQVKPPLQLQVAHPPDWLPEAHTAADLGEYLRNCEERRRSSTDAFRRTGRFGYHFPHPKQEEDILTETNVKDGLHLPTPVAVRLSLSFYGI